jgi:site-specific DNA recombinase
MSVSSNQKRAAIYVRVSTSGQEDDGTSLQSQLEHCRAYAVDNGYQVDQNHIYREVYTGSELWERPKLSDMRAAVRDGAVDVVVAYAIDRLSRDPVHLGVIISEADHAGVTVDFVSEPLDQSPEGELIRFVRGYAYKLEIEKIRERQMRGKLTRVQSGKIHGFGGELFGYRRDKERGVRVIVESEAEIVRMIYHWIGIDGVPIRSVIRRLNEQGVPSPGTRNREFKSGRKPRWGNGVIGRILRNPAYKGETILWRTKRKKRNKPEREVRPENEQVRLDGVTPPIVSAELWDAVQRQLDSNRGDKTRNQKHQYLLRGHIYCSECGRRLYASPSHGQRYYRCSSRETAAGACGAKSVNSDHVEEWLWGHIMDILANPDVIAAEVDNQRESDVTERLHADRESAVRRLARIDTNQSEMLASFRRSQDDDGLFPWHLVEREIKQAEKDKQALRDMIAGMTLN